MGYVEHERGDVDAARRHFEASLSTCRAHNDTWAIADVLYAMGSLSTEVEDWANAKAAFMESLLVATRSDSTLGRARALAGLGRLSIGTGRLQHARQTLLEALSLGLASKSWQHCARALADFIELEAANGSAERVVVLHALLRRECTVRGLVLAPRLLERLDRVAASARSVLAEKDVSTRASASANERMSLEQVVGYLAVEPEPSPPIRVE